MIETFPNWGDIELQDQSAFEDFTKREDPVTSGMTFVNLFAWRQTYSFKLTALDGTLCAIVSQRDSSPFLLPPLAASDATGITLKLFDFLREQGHNPVMRCAPETLTERLLQESPELFKVKLDRNNSDYVYLASDLSALAGRRYHKKRNLISQFKTRYIYDYRRITPDLLPQCLEFQEIWCNQRDCSVPDNADLAEENRAIHEALNNFQALGLFGGVILIDGKVQAYSVAGRLNSDTLVVHFEKGNPEFIGIYQALNQEFCVDFCNGYKFVNREQDLGDPGLRQAKQSYYPHHMINKYTITPR